ncbi:hypothetical protein Lalb_Chr25g0283151 [Lupinus albus]|uniref:Uncharacterized protein n=1 Tax=Lupinus albus TaxID=3870 RepID=A0A6A4MYG6_LUPAL|nr:hypothetical protein Lalb_Chr25g0283151 [Lupinus albus]
MLANMIFLNLPITWYQKWLYYFKIRKRCSTNLLVRLLNNHKITRLCHSFHGRKQREYYQKQKITTKSC